MVLPALFLAVLVATATFVGERERPARDVVYLTVIGVCVLGFVLARARFGATAMERRLGAKRSAWAARRGWRAEPFGEADPGDADLLLAPRWRVEYVVARAQRRGPRGEERVETWRLRGPMGSIPRTTHREIVSITAATGPVRFAAPSIASAGSILGAPAWTRAGRRWSLPQTEPVWADRVRGLLAAHDDLPLMIAVGNDRVVVSAVDDPRSEAAEARIELARAVAAVAAA